MPRRLVAAFVLLLMATLGVSPTGTSAQTSALRRCDLGDTWPSTPGALAGYVFLGHTIPDRFGALRIAVDRVFDGNVPSEVLIVRSCLDHVWFDDGQLLLVAASGSLAETPLDDGGPRRLWLTQDRAAIWQVGETGRLTVAGLDERSAPPGWLLDLRFVADVVRAVMGDEAPGTEAFQPGGRHTGSSVALPPLAGPMPSGPPWSPAVTDGSLGSVQAVTTWRGGFAALGRDSLASDDGRWVVWTSPDGVTWQKTPGALRGLTRDVWNARIVGHRDAIVVAAAVGLDLVLWRSTDGVTWRRLPDRRIFQRPSAITMPGEWYLGIAQVAVGNGRLRIAGTWKYHDCLNCPSWSTVWTTEDGREWQRSRPASRAFDWSLLEGTDVMGTDRGFVALRVIVGADPDEPGCSLQSRVWRSGDGTRWNPVRGGERLCLPPWPRQFAVTADPVSGSLFALVRDGERAPTLLRSRDGKRWTTVGVPFPDGWNVSGVAARGDTIVLLGSGPTSEGGHGTVPIVSRDGGTTWTTSAGWPALLDELTSVAIGDDVIVAGVSYPAGTTHLVLKR